MFANFSVLFSVDLISDEDFCNVFVSMLIDAFEPHFHVLERVRICHVEAEYDPLRLLVEAERESAEPFLPCCVLKLTFGIRIIVKIPHPVLFIILTKSLHQSKNWFVGDQIHNL